MIIPANLTKAANKLHLKDERHVAFGCLALHHLRSTASPAAPYGSSAHLDKTTLSFMEQFGLRLWPAYAPQRVHLSSTSTVTAGARGGLFYAKACGLVRADLKAWKAANDGRQPTEEEQLLGSRIGRPLRAYFQVLATIDARSALGLKEEEVVDGMAAEELLESVLLKAKEGS